MKIISKTYKMYKILVFLLTICSVKTSKDKLIAEDINGLIASFGDFDSDKFTDVFVITDNGKALQLIKAYPTEPVLRKWTSIKCSFNLTDDIIVGVIASDFTGKAMMDVLVVTKPTANPYEGPFNLYLLKGSLNSLDCNTSKPLVKNVKSHPLVLDFNGDMISDFIVETDDCLRQLWTRPRDPTLIGVIPLQADCPTEIQPTNHSNTMRFPNSNAFINLDKFNQGNMAPDIYISGKDSMEYLLDKKGFKKSEIVFINTPNKDIYKHLGQSAFVDINIDGQIDHILAVCKTAISDGQSCKDPEIIGYDMESKDWITISDFFYGNHSTDLTFTEIETFGQRLPITLRHGDIDGDGYTDLITVMKNNKNEWKAVILKNIRGDNVFKRKFVIDWTSDKHLESGLNVEIAAFIDLFEDGKLDILMTTKDKNNVLAVEAVVNTQMIAACFLKVLVTSGLCYGSTCPRGNIPYGTNQFGPFVCYQLQDLDGNWQTGCAGQLSQSSHSALQMPYSVFGLGETPNFVENVYASIPSGTGKSRHGKWTQIVPDAQVVLIPFPPNDPDNWVSKLFYTPSNIVFSTLITLASICCLLVLIIGILHRKELLEDLAEHEEYKRHWPESR